MNNNSIDNKTLFENYKYFFETSPISMALLDLNGNIVEINSATEELVRMNRDDLIGKNFMDIPIIFCGDLHKFVEIFKNLKEGKIFGPKDILMKDKAGNKFWINVVASLVKVGDQFFIQFITQDITSRKELVQKLENSERKYRLISENANDLIIVLDSKNEIEYINEKVHQKITGYSNEDVVGLNGLKFVHPEDRERILLAFQETMKVGEGSVEVRIKHKNGNYIWVECNGKVSKTESGDLKVLIIGRDVSEKVKYIKKLKESKDRFQNLADSLPEVVFEIDLDFNVIYANSAANKVFGYSEEDFKKGLKIFHFIKHEDKDFVLENIEVLKKGEYVDPLVVQLRKKDGTFFYAEIHGKRIFKDNEVIGVRSIIHDITDMRFNQERTKESEEKFRTISEQSLLGICLIQDEFVKYVNRTLANLLGYSIKEILDWKQNEFFKAIHPEDKKKVIELATKADQEFPDGIRFYEARGIKKNGEIIWLEVYYRKITFQKKPAFLISFMDISERKKTQDLLRDSEEKYRILFEKAPFSILLINTNGIIIDCNPTLTKLFGYDKSDLIGKNYINLPIVLKEHVPILQERLKKIREGQMLPPIDIQVYKKDGTIIWINFESTLVKMGNEKFFITMGYNISEKKEAEKKLYELDKIRKEFIDRASHELKTPITTIYGAYQLIDQFHKQKLHKDVIEIFEMAFSGTKKLKKLVDDLLDLSHLESKVLKLEKGDIDLIQLVRKCVSELEFLMKSKLQTHNLILPKSLIINIDESRMELVLSNLLSNAIKYTPNGGEITVKVEKLNKFAQISVKDTGIGLRKDEMEKLFKKFSKIRKSFGNNLERYEDGTGLGLHIAKEIVELHDGKIWVESGGKSKGTTFFVNLPLK
ncbi:MAG: PAS domain S-box protein [Promethearchaeota archaeon]